MPQSPVVTFWLLLIWPLDILDMIWLGLLLAESRKASDPGRRKVDAAFAWLFLVRYPVHLALSVWTPAGAEYWAIAITKLLALYTNLLPVFWLKAYFVPWAGSLGKVLGGRFDLPAIRQARGLSSREMEILELMIDGKSCERSSDLHISIHTVKSHAHSLYRKMDVRAATSSSTGSGFTAAAGRTRRPIGRRGQREIARRTISPSSTSPFRSTTSPAFPKRSRLS
jgi:DNA-binding CsgD family transcriptional regulator